jgi:TQXA domain-containing protein/LPXTG-motif cell wall-anchored protein
MSHAQRVPARLWATLLAALLAAVGMIALGQPAHATDGEGHVTGTAEKGSDVKIVWHHDGKDEPLSVPTRLYKLELNDGGTLKTYCINFGPNAHSDVPYGEVSWDESGLEPDKVKKINWILRNTYPYQKDLDELAEKFGLDELTAEDAIGSAQLAIWTLSDPITLGEGNSDTIKKIYDYLTGEANTGEPEPTVSLDLVADDTSGHDGEKIGPFTVKTVAESVKVRLQDDAPEGVKLVDKDGKDVGESVPAGAELFVDVPAGTAPGEVTILAEAKAKVAVGRIFVGKAEIEAQTKKKTQSQIVADSDESCLKAEAKAVWTKENKVPVPGAKAYVDCKKGGVVVKLTNTGKAPSPFTVKAGEFSKEVTVEAGGEEQVLVPVAEDAEYSITVTGPAKFVETFKGRRDCEVAPSPTPTPKPTVKPRPGPVPPSLPDTGANNLPLQLGIVAALLLLGGGLVFLVRRRNAQQAQAESDS